MDESRRQGGRSTRFWVVSTVVLGVLAILVRQVGLIWGPMVAGAWEYLF